MSHPITRSHRRRAAAVLAASAAICAGGAVATAGPAAAACSDVEVVFARGTGEAQGPSVLQPGVVNALKSAAGGRSVSSYSVVYPAASNQNAKPGAEDLVRRVRTVAAECPNTTFVLGGYSQGATVVDLALGVAEAAYFGGGAATPLPADLGSKVAAIVTFGNPLGNNRLAAAAPAYASRVKEFCASGDPVCRNGSNFVAHFAYISDGSTQQAGQFAAGRLGTSVSPGTPTTGPTTGPTPAPQPTRTPWWRWWARG